jgi:hypothetical protein
MLSDFLKRYIRVVANKVIECFKLLASEGRFSALILRVRSDGSFPLPSLPQLLNPPRCYLKLLGNLFEGVATGIMSRQNTFP